MEESLYANRAGGRVSCKKNCDGPQVDSSKRSQRHQCIGNSHTALRLDRGLAARTFTRVRHIVRHSRRRDLALAILYHIRWVNQSICVQKHKRVRTNQDRRRNSRRGIGRQFSGQAST